MSTLKRLVALTLSLLMLLPCLGGAAAAEQEPNPYVELLENMTIQEAYDEYVSLLNMYLNNDPETPVDIELLSQAFDRVNWAYSFEFNLYTQVLSLLEEDNFVDAVDWLLALQISDEEFEAYLASDEFRADYFNILGTDVLAVYLEARRQEASHNESTAGDLYKQCLRFFDAKERYVSNRIDPDALADLVLQQIADGDYANAVANAQRLIASGHDKGQALHNVANQKLQQAEVAAHASPIPSTNVTPVPETAPVVEQPTGNVDSMTVKSNFNKSHISLSWDAVQGANEYRVYRARGVDGQYQQIATITKTNYQDYDFVKGIFNGYYVEALNGSQLLKVSEHFAVYAVVETPKPTPVPTPKPTAVPTPKPTAVPTPKPTATPTPVPVWGAWSGWSTTAVSASSTRQVETKVESVPVYGTKYTYNRWTYKSTDGKTWWSYVKYTGSSYVSGSGYWQYASSMSPFPSSGSVDGRTRYKGANGYSGYWYNQSTSQVQTGTNNITYYRYRDLQ